MAEHQVRLERGSGHVLVICSCGWRDLCFTEREVRAYVHAHKTLHGDTAGASDFVKKRRKRSS